ncbi:hypothetical protein ASPCAL11687 [Aspergillus calidoustus]|uniref:Uncharacterized protein n=1 Tax=Aspergillus calidoustus TaxID=454130 RepID=A0A0U5CES3_ASPCI|nr:hypothetical protein ASPCAL11687 [Aspergillus calidoustus]
MQNDAGDTTVRRFFTGLCRLIRRYKGTNTSTRDRENVQVEIEIERPLLSFCGIKRRRKRNSTIRDTATNDPTTVPEDLDTLLADYSLALTPRNAASTNHIVLSRPRIDAILHLLLAQAKKRLLETDTTEKINTLYWDYEQFISLSDTLGARRRRRIPNCAVDYALWYGDARDFATNCVVIRARDMIVGGESRQFFPILVAMSLIKHNRVRRKVNREVYGICTNSFTWVFFHLDKRNKLNSLRLNWANGQQQAITAVLSKILNEAVKLRLLSSKPADTWSDSKTRLSPWDVRKWNYAEDKEDNAADFTPSGCESPPGDTKPGGAEKAVEPTPTQDPSTADLASILLQDMHEVLDLKHQPDEDYIWSLGALGEYKMMPDHLKSIFKDYKLAFGDKFWCEVLTRVKFEALLFIVLALIKKRDFGPDTLAPSSSLQ